MGDRLVPVGRRLTLYRQPALSSALVARVSHDQRLIELERMGAWVLVAVGKSGVQGWARMSALKPLSGVASVAHRAADKAGRVVRSRVSGEGTRERGAEAGVAAATFSAPVSTRGSTSFLSSRDFDLLDLGLKDGIVFDGSGGHGKTIFFPAPLDSDVSSGEFVLRYQASSMMLDRANLRVSINDRPMKVRRIASDGMVHQFSVLLPPSLFRKRGLVKVRISGHLIGSDDRCRDERDGALFVRILPETTLHIAYHPALHSVRDYWRMLPRHVVLSLPAGKLTPEVFKSAWSMMVMLEKAGKVVRLTRLPEIGHIVIASRAQLQDQIRAHPVKRGGTAKFARLFYPESGKGANIALARYGNHRFLALSEPFDTTPFYLLDDHWNTLAAGQHYRLFPLTYASYRFHMRLPSHSMGKRIAIPVERIGINTRVQKMFRSTSWTTTVGPYDFPSGVRMSRLRLDVVAPVRDERDPKYELYVYLNDILLRSMRLKDSGAVQSFEIPLPKKYQMQFNKLAIVAEHDVDNGDCRGIPPTDPFQILPSSRLLLVRHTGDPENFFDLTYYFSDGFDTYIEEEGLVHADRILYLLTRIAVDYPLLADMSRVHFVAAGSRLEPSGPFWAIGAFDLGDIEAPVRFDKGRVSVVDHEGNVLLDVDRLPDVTTMQIARAGRFYGLLIHPDRGRDYLFPEALHLQRDDIAFLDDNGIILSLDSHHPTLVRMFYPDVSTWFDVFDAYRFWIFAFGWFLLSVLALYIFRQMRHQRALRKAAVDDIDH